MVFAARYKGTCVRCHKPIVPGQLIHWKRNRLVKNCSWHHNCDTPDAPATAPVTPITGGDVTPSKDGCVEVYVGDDGIAHIYKPKTDTPEPTPESKPAPAADPVTIGDRLAASEHTATVETPTNVLIKIPDSGPDTMFQSKAAGKSLPLSTLRTSSDWHAILPAILPYTNRVLIIGPPGTGKSTTALNIAGIKHRITMTETTSREDLIGMFHLIDGATKWVDGPITAAMRAGVPVLTDEIDRYSPECASLFYGVIDDKPHIALPNGEIVHAADGYKMIMTSNESLDTLPPAVQDRIEVILYAGTPHDAAIAHLPAAQRSAVSAYYNGVPKPSIKLPPTVRRMRAFHKLTAAGMDARIAATLVFGPDGAKEVTSAITSAESGIR